MPLIIFADADALAPSIRQTPFLMRYIDDITPCRAAIIGLLFSPPPTAIIAAAFLLVRCCAAILRLSRRLIFAVLPPPCHFLFHAMPSDISFSPFHAADICRRRHFR